MNFVVSFSFHFIFTKIILREKGLAHPLTWDYTPETPKIDVSAKTASKFPAPAGLDDTFSVICINSFPTFYFWAASVICLGFDFSFHFHFTLPPASETTLHFIFTSFELPDFISFSLHFPTPSEIGALVISLGLALYMNRETVFVLFTDRSTHKSTPSCKPICEEPWCKSESRHAARLRVASYSSATPTPPTTGTH